MTKKNKKNLSLNKELSKSTDHAARLIASLTRKDLALIKAKGNKEIFQHLSYLLSRLNKEEKELNWRNDKTASRDLTTDSHGYQLVAKGIYNPRYKAYGTGQALHDFIKFFSAKLGDLAFQRVLNSKVSSNLSNPYASIAQPHTAYIASGSINKAALESILSRMQITNPSIAPSKGF